MAAVSVEVAGLWPLSLGVVAFLTLLIIFSIFFVALCIDCHRRSFELKDPEADKKNPQSLIRVVKLEETMARDNPMIGEIHNDEKEFNSNGEEPVAYTPWRSHLGAAQNNKDQTNGSAAAMEAGGEPVLSICGPHPHCFVDGPSGCQTQSQVPCSQELLLIRCGVIRSRFCVLLIPPCSH